MEFPKQNIELVLCILTQIDYIPGVASEAEGFTQSKHKGDKQTHERLRGMAARVNTYVYFWA